MITKTKNPALLIILALMPLWLMAMPARAAEMVDYPVVKLQSLDKATARTMTFEAKVGTTVKFGPLYIKVQTCRKAPPLEPPESAAFLQIWEVTRKAEAKWVFSGWMFASSPALSPMDHPIYDVWVIDCLEGKSDEGGQESGADDEGEDKDGEEPEEDSDADGDIDAADDSAEETSPMAE